MTDQQSCSSKDKGYNRLYLQAMGIACWQRRQLEIPVQRLILLIPPQDWQQPKAQQFLAALCNEQVQDWLEYRLASDVNLAQKASEYWSLGLISMTVGEQLPSVPQLMAKADLKKQLWQKLWRWKQTYR